MVLISSHVKNAVYAQCKAHTLSTLDLYRQDPNVIVLTHVAVNVCLLADILTGIVV
jgi:hypothetical protein